MRRAPSIRVLTLMKDVDTKTARLIRGAIKTDWRDDLLKIAAQVTGRDLHQVRLDYINHNEHALRSEVLNKLLRTFGIETTPKGVEFLNAGDLYAPTLAHWRGRWQVTTEADIRESEERHGSR